MLGNNYNAVAYNFELITTASTPSVRELSIHQRKCVFRDEILLDVNNIYNPTACMMQCKFGEVIEKCNCILPGYYNSGKVEL